VKGFRVLEKLNPKPFLFEVIFISWFGERQQKEEKNLAFNFMEVVRYECVQGFLKFY
jgi:hypothetical protein